jgi:hypothetical protein
VRPEDLTTEELRVLTEAALAAWSVEPEGLKKAELQREHHRLARVLGPRVRAERSRP